MMGFEFFHLLDLLYSLIIISVASILCILALLQIKYLNSDLGESEKVLAHLYRIPEPGEVWSIGFRAPEMRKTEEQNAAFTLDEFGEIRFPSNRIPCEETVTILAFNASTSKRAEISDTLACVTVLRGDGSVVNIRSYMLAESIV